MKKSECETAIRSLCHEWASETGEDRSAKDFHPSFWQFKSWLKDKGYGHYLTFRSRVDPDEDAELWFDQELKQMWRR